MGLLARVLGFFFGTTEPGRSPATPGVPPPSLTPYKSESVQTYVTSIGDITLTATISTSDRPQVNVSETEVSQAVEQYRFVLRNELPSLKTAEKWWEEDSHNRRLKEGSPKARAWLEPFVSLELAQKLQLKAATNPWGPMGANGLAKELRAIIRERRKSKQPHADELRALYGACLLEVFVKSLAFQFVQPRILAGCLGLGEVRAMQLEYQHIGYLHMPALGKSDVKWLVEALGEPNSHMQPADAFASLRQQAISRYCWTELARDSSYGSKDALAMERWLKKMVEIELRISKENDVVMAARAVRQEQRNRFYELLPQAWAATENVFVVADLETSGLNSEVDHILEFGAVRVSSDGTVLAEYSSLVKADCVIPPLVTRLTGITLEDIARKGRPLPEALKDFVEFAGDLPVFFHNAHFDQGFLEQAAKKVGRRIGGPVYDTLVMAQQAFPQAESLKLVDLAAQVGVKATHRALQDAHATLAVLLAAKREVQGVPAK